MMKILFSLLNLDELFTFKNWKHHENVRFRAPYSFLFHTLVNEEKEKPSNKPPNWSKLVVNTKQTQTQNLNMKTSWRLKDTQRSKPTVKTEQSYTRIEHKNTFILKWRGPSKDTQMKQTNGKMQIWKYNVDYLELKKS